MEYIDWHIADALLEEVGPEDFAEIVGLLLSEIEEAAHGLASFASGQDLSDALHGLKGNVLNLGFQNVAAMCAKGEADPDALDVAALQLLVEQTVGEFHRGRPSGLNDSEKS